MAALDESSASCDPLEKLSKRIILGPEAPKPDPFTVILAPSDTDPLNEDILGADKATEGITAKIAMHKNHFFITSISFYFLINKHLYATDCFAEPSKINAAT
jgi:hypothetical protein